MLSHGHVAYGRGFEHPASTPIRARTSGSHLQDFETQHVGYPAQASESFSVTGEADLNSRSRRLWEANWILRTWRPRPERLVICRPHGGLNDTLVQFSASIRFARKTRRRVLLDLNHQGSGIRLSAGGLFTLPLSRAADAVCLDTERPTRFPSSWLWFPPESRDLAYKSKPCTDGPRTTAGSLLRLPEDDVKEHAIVHESWGGGDDHVLALKALRLSEELQMAVHKVASEFPASEFSTHLRFTDARVSLEHSLSRLKSVVSGGLFLASDSEEVVQRAQQALSDVSIYSLPQPRSVDNTSVHCDGLSLSKFIYLMSDIYLLTTAKTFITFPLAGTPGWISGVARLVETFRALPSLRRWFFGY